MNEKISDFDICESDDEWSVYKPQQTETSNDPYIPNKLLPLFKEIDNDKVLKLTCICPRKGNLKDTQQSNLSQAIIPPTQLPLPDVKKEKDATDANKSFEAFDFDTDDNNERPSAKRKTPASAKRDKKGQVASMSNVMKDLVRSRLRNELEAVKADELTDELM